MRIKFLLFAIVSFSVFICLFLAHLNSDASITLTKATYSNMSTASLNGFEAGGCFLCGDALDCGVKVECGENGTYERDVNSNQRCEREIGGDDWVCEEESHTPCYTITQSYIYIYIYTHIYNT